jgi:hypothetical protein
MASASAWEIGASRLLRAREVLFDYLGTMPEPPEAARSLEREKSDSLLEGESNARMQVMCEELASLCEARAIAESLGGRKESRGTVRHCRSL